MSRNWKICAREMEFGLFYGREDVEHNGDDLVGISRIFCHPGGFFCSNENVNGVYQVQNQFCTSVMCSWEWMAHQLGESWKPRYTGIDLGDHLLFSSYALIMPPPLPPRPCEIPMQIRPSSIWFCIFHGCSFLLLYNRCDFTLSHCLWNMQVTSQSDPLPQHSTENATSEVWQIVGKYVPWTMSFSSDTLSYFLLQMMFLKCVHARLRRTQVICIWAIDIM